MAQPGVEGLGPLTEIGRGGFGVVYRAEDRAHSRTVAVKVLRHTLDESGQARFERECRAAGSLSGHPNIVSIHGSGVTSEAEPYLVMDHLPGGSLAERVQRDGPLEARAAIELGVGLAGALAAAHERSIVHRDVKPENVLYSAFGLPQLVDFGIARMASEFETRSGSISASLAHAPPEVIAGAPATIASDVYSLASVLHFALSGTAPFDGGAEESLAPLIARITTMPPRDLREFGVPDPLATTVERGLAKDPADRPPSAQAFGEELRAAAKALGEIPPTMVSAEAIREAAPDNPLAVTVDLTRGSTPVRPRRRLITSVAVVATLVAGVVIVARPWGDGTGATSPSTTVTEERSIVDPLTDDAGLGIARSYDLVEDDAVGSTIELSNTSETAMKRVWIEVIPKELATRVADVEFSPRPTGTVQDDPIVYWVVTLEPGAAQTFTWTTPIPTTGASTPTYLKRVVRLHRSAVSAAAEEIATANESLEEATGAVGVDPSVGAGDPSEPVGQTDDTTGSTETTQPSGTIATTSTTTTTTAPSVPKPGAPSAVVVKNPTALSGATKPVRVTLTWSPPSSGGGGVTGYRIRHQQLASSGCSAGSAWIETAVGTTTSSTPTADTQCGSSWIVWQVAAVNAAGVGPYKTATGILPDVVGLQQSYHLVRAVGGRAGGLADRDCGVAPYAACYTSVAAGTTIAAGTSVAISLQFPG